MLYNFYIYEVNGPPYFFFFFFVCWSAGVWGWCCISPGVVGGCDFWLGLVLRSMYAGFRRSIEMFDRQLGSRTV